MASQPPPSRDLLVRTLSACVFVPAILLAVYWGGRWLLLLVLLVVGRGSWELFVLAERAGRHPSRALGIAGALGLSLLAYGSGTQHLATALVAVALLALADALRHGTEGYLASALLTVGGVVYTGLLGTTSRSSGTRKWNRG